MTRIGALLHATAASVLVAGGWAHALWTPNPARTEVASLSGIVAPPESLPDLYLNPGNPVMWALLTTVWLMVLMDAVGQLIDPSDDEPIRAGRPRVWPMTMLAVALAALLPQLLNAPGWLAAATLVSAACATIGAQRAVGRHRPAIGFFAGWATAMASAAVATLASARFGLPVQAVSALAILPAAAVGMAAQVWIGSSISYSTALIWAFCGLAITTMGSDPLIALAAILGISAMATVLVRAAS